MPLQYWWEAYRPSADELVEVPRSARVAIVGGAYAGLSTALELAKLGIEAFVLEANEFGFLPAMHGGDRRCGTSASTEIEKWVVVSKLQEEV